MVEAWAIPAVRGSIYDNTCDFEHHDGFARAEELLRSQKRPHPPASLNSALVNSAVHEKLHVELDSERGEVVTIALRA